MSGRSLSQREIERDFKSQIFQRGKLVGKQIWRKEIKRGADAPLKLPQLMSLYLSKLAFHGAFTFLTTFAATAFLFWWGLTTGWRGLLLIYGGADLLHSTTCTLSPQRLPHAADLAPHSLHGTMLLAAQASRVRSEPRSARYPQSPPLGMAHSSSQPDLEPDLRICSVKEVMLSVHCTLGWTLAARSPPTG